MAPNIEKVSVWVKISCHTVYHTTAYFFMPVGATRFSFSASVSDQFTAGKTSCGMQPGCTHPWKLKG